MKTPFARNQGKTAVFMVILLIMVRCGTDQFLKPSNESYAGDVTATAVTSAETTDCLSCSFVVPPDMYIVDGAALGLKPGSVIGLNANVTYMGLKFRNIVGTPENPIIIRNCGGTARIDGTGKHDALKTEISKHFRITGGDIDGSYGIVVSGARMSVNLGSLSTDFEVDHVKIINSGFAGIMAKTDPNCDPATWRANFLMENVKLHHNYISDTGGEGIYAGNSFFTGMSLSCGLQLPHEIHNIEIYSNILKNTGWDAIQLGCATQGASVHGNTIENYGVANQASQNSGIQISSGTGGLCYNNLIRKGTGHGMGVFGIGDNVIYNNIIDAAGDFGIFCDERATTGQGFKFLNNTILNPARDGIVIYAELVPMNVIANNIITNPGSYSSYTPERSELAFIRKLSNDVKVTLANNYFSRSTDSLRITNLLTGYRMEGTSPVIDKGADVSAHHIISQDFYNHARISGSTTDIGAVETSSELNLAPVANAGSDEKLSGVSQFVLRGTATDKDGSVVSYKWSQYGGTPVVMSDPDAPSTLITGLTQGKFYFRLTVEDDDGAIDFDNVLIRVIGVPVVHHDEIPLEENIAPVADAGADLALELPQNTVQLYGSGRDSDGAVTGYYWTQYAGPSAVMADVTAPTATVTVSVAGDYYFRLTVKDDDGATHYDDVLVKVTGATLPDVTTNQVPVANAGPDYTLTLPLNSVTLYGSGTDSDGTIVSYAWIQYGGATAAIDNADSPSLSITNLAAGSYYFRLTVTDDKGATDYDNVLVKVNSPL